VLLLFIPGVVIAMAGLLVLNHNSSGVIGGALAVVFLALLVAVEVPLILRAQDRRQEALTGDLTDGAFYAGRASMVGHDRGRRLPTPGTIVFSDAGIRFSPKTEGAVGLELAWDTISGIRLRPQPGKIGIGLLRLALNDGGSRTFTVPRYGPMARVLAEHS
jgi:hypothetical protein